MSKIFKFGEDVKGYSVPVMNEHEIRAAAGILFFATYTSFLMILFNSYFLPFKYVVSIFLVDFIIRVFINPRFSPTLILARLIVKNQTPEYVGAAQKRFAWVIGVILSAAMFYYFMIINATSSITGFICLICMVFLFFEAAFGICLGCMFYPLFFRKKAQYCPGDVCEVKSKQEIQRVSCGQIAVLILFVSIIVLTATYMNDRFSSKPGESSAGPKVEQPQGNQ